MPLQIKRKIDDQGRLPIPLPMRQMCNLNFKDAVVWTIEGNKVVLRSAGNALGLTGQVSTRVDDVGKVPVPRSVQQLGVVPGVEVELNCENGEISFAAPQN